MNDKQEMERARDIAWQREYAEQGIEPPRHQSDMWNMGFETGYAAALEAEKKVAADNHLFVGPSGGRDVRCEVCGIPYGVHLSRPYKLEAGKAKWVPVSERLPGFNAWYLISYGAYVHEAYFWTATKDWSYNRPPESDRREVIEPPVAWMPLPKPYTPGGKCYPTALDAFRELQEADQ
jgi:hypothetical protein